MSKLIFGQDKALSRWCANGLAPPQGRAIGIGNDAGTKLYAVVVYHTYDAAHRTITVSFRSVWPGWVTKETIRRLFSVPFLQYDCRKMWAIISEKNTRSKRLAAGMGWKMEARVRHHFADGEHGELWSMMRSEFDAKWGTPHSFARSRSAQKAQRLASIARMKEVEHAVGR
jgi:RimJ/RimL family protein N-acetyltransferase